MHIHAIYMQYIQHDYVPHEIVRHANLSKPGCVHARLIILTSIRLAECHDSGSGIEESAVNNPSLKICMCAVPPRRGILRGCAPSTPVTPSVNHTVPGQRFWHLRDLVGFIFRCRFAGYRYLNLRFDHWLPVLPGQAFSGLSCHNTSNRYPLSTCKSKAACIR